MDTKALRQKILDLAIRGKLVPQDPNDEPASVLLERIREQKRHMVEEGKLKPKDIKNDTIIYKGEDNLHYEKFQDGTVKCIEDEIPFEIPEGWAWCRGISCFAGMGMKKPQGQYFDYIDIDSIDNKNHRIISPKHLPVKSAPSRASREVGNGSVLFSLVRPYLENIAYINSEHQHCIASTGFYVCNSNGAFVPKFMFILMTSQYVIMGLNEYMKGDNSPSIRKEHIENWLYPVPPINEQIKISTCLNKAMSLYENIKTNKEELTELIKTVKSHILDLAIRGKLVPQDPNDEPASVLLERIRAEKEELIKQGKIKRDKKESVIFKGEDNSYYEKIGDEVTRIDEEMPFEIPDSWMWCRLRYCCKKEIKRGKAPKYSECSNILVFAQKCNTKYNGIYMELAQFLDISTLRKYSKDEYLQDGDIVINSTGTGTLGRVGLYRDSDNERGLLVVPDTHVTIIRSASFIKEYLYFVLKKYQSLLEESGEGSTNQKELRPDVIANLLVPVPPLDEQRKIVNQVQLLNFKLSAIEANLS